MAKRRESKCLCCGDKFTLDVRNRGRQKYCSKQSCRAAGKAARQRRWLAKPENKNYYREADNAARVREWQRKNPGYWRNTARYRRRTLQDALPAQAHESHEETSTLALQDALRLQGPVLIGLRREDKSLAQRIRRARFPVQKTLDQFQWSWPKKINRPQIQNLFRLNFIEQKANVIFLGTVGLGKTHLSIALGQAACARGYSVLFTSAIDIIHTLAAAAGTGSLKRTMQRYLKPSLIIMDEIGYLPIDKLGADLLFQVISERYERGAILMSTNRAFKTWPEIFNNDTTLTSALLDRLLHHADICQIEGPSYRAKDHIES